MKKIMWLTSMILLANLAIMVPTSANTPSTRMNGLSLTEGDSLQTGFSNISAWAPDNSRSDWIWCSTVDDPDCSEKNIRVLSFLLPCSSEATVACIREVYAETVDGTKVAGEFIRAIGTNSETDFAEVPGRGIAAGKGMGGIWNFPNLTNGGGSTTYAVQARISGDEIQPTNTSSLKVPLKYDRVEFGIAAVREISGPYLPNKILLWPNTPDDRIRGADTISSNGRPDFKCAMTESGKCFERVSFPSGYRFGLSIYLPNELSGWFHGRIYTPEISSIKVGSGFEYSIEASPVKVPYVREEIRSSSWPKELIDYVDSKFFCNTSGDCEGTSGGFMLPGNSGKLAFDLTSMFLPLIKDKSTGTGDYWSIRTLDMWNESSSAQTIQSCSEKSSSVSGIVTTNSMVYNAGPPTYNSETGSLDYRVLSPHYDDKGGENIGTYDLLLNSKVARCIYGFSDAPVKAEIEILGSDGTNKVATTVIGEKNGMLFMSANGFTYSEPTVRIKLTQESPAPTPIPSVTPAPTQTPVSVITPPATKKVSITCVKGSKFKKVTGTRPKCPKGFKKA